MRLARFSTGVEPRLGVVLGDEVADVTSAWPAVARDRSLLAPSGLAALTDAALAAPRFALSEVTLLAPVAEPRKFLAIGLNYADHIAESPFDTPEFPVVFNKQTTSVNGPYADVERPLVSEQVDYEGELGFVIGRRCRGVPRDRAHEVIAGYLVLNDVSVRDWQLRTPTMTMGKSFDTHGPIGPWLVTADELSDPHDLAIRTWVNGELRQESNTDQLVFDAFDLVEHLSCAFTLEPGDIVATGTPAGVGATGSRWLRDGDVVRVEIEGVGAIENRIVDQPSDTFFIEDDAMAVAS